MDNAVDALKMGFAVIAFVIALTVSIVAMAQAKETSEKVFYMTDKTNFYEYLSDKKLPDGRIVSGETIIPTLYRYYITKKQLDYFLVAHIIILLQDIR